MTYQVKNRFQNVPFKRNLQRYSAACAWWGCTSCIQFTHTMKGAWFQPLN
jgi:hypothetical protein